MKLSRGAVAALATVAAVTIATAAVVYTSVHNSAIEDARSAFGELVSTDVNLFRNLLNNTATASRGIADAVSAMPSYPSRASFQRVCK